MLSQNLEHSIEILYKEIQDLNHTLKAEVSETHRKEMLLQEEKQTLQEILESVPGLFYFFDVNGYIIRWNKELELVSGYSLDELPKMNFLDFFQETDKNRIKDTIKKIILEGWGTFEANMVNKDQTKASYFFSGKRINYKEKQCIIGMAYEISERKVVELKLIEQFEELRRWQSVTLAREGRILELKREVNQLLRRASLPDRYPCAEKSNQAESKQIEEKSCKNQ